MYVSEIIASIQDGIDDPTILSDAILVAVNKNLKRITAMVKIPDLIEEDGDTVNFNAGSHYTDMPDEYEPAHGILYAYSQTNSTDLIVRPNTKVLYKDRDRTTTGSIIEVAADGKMLYCYDGSEEADIVLLKFYGKPDDLRLTDIYDDEPDFLPEHLQDQLLVDGTILDLLKFKRYLEGEKMSMDRDNAIKKECTANYSAAIAELKMIFPEPPKPKLSIRRTVRDF